jgi:broad specificity phosphatase PhoE
MKTSQCCTIYLVRHGQTYGNADQIIQGHSDISLTEKGEQQAHERRSDLKHIYFSKVYSSDLIRAKRTAEILNLERKCAHQTTELLRERYFGSYEGKRQEEGRRMKLWDLLDSYALYKHSHIRDSGIETNEQVIGRSLSFLREVSLVHLNQNILVVSHGGLMRILLVHLGYAQPNQFIHGSSGAIQNLAWIKLECDGFDFTVKDTLGITLDK